MADSPFPPDKRGKNPRSLANLRKPFGKGENHNPEGKNGRTRAELVANFLDQPEDTEAILKLVRKLGLPDNTPRIIALLHRELLQELAKGNCKTLIELYGGKARMQVDLSNSDGSMTQYRENPIASMLEAMIVRATAGPAKDAAKAVDDKNKPTSE